MSQQTANRDAEAFIEARRTGKPLDALPLKPGSLADAYAIQDIVGAKLGPIRAWKTGAPGPAEPATFAPIFDVLSSPATLGGRMFGVEVEIAFRMGKDLPARERPYTQDAVRAAIGSVHPAIEVVESRFADFRAQDKLSVLADFTSNGALVLGPAAKWPEFDMGKPPARLVIDGKVIAEAGANSGGNPLRLLTELANHASQRTGALKAGQVVTTGSVTGLLFAKAGAHVVADYGEWGRVEVTFRK